MTYIFIFTEIETNNKCEKKSNDKIISDYPNMTYGMFIKKKLISSNL